MKIYQRLWLCVLIIPGFISCTSEQPETMVGTLERDRIELKVESDEPIIAIHVSDGAMVQAGDLVLEQDSQRHQARLDQLAALRDQAEARLAELQRGPRQEAIREAQARLTASAAVSRNARTEFERAQTVFERGLSNESTLDSARTAFETAEANERASREALQSLLSGTTVEELQQARAALAASEARLRESRIALQRLKLHAPASGIVDKVLFEAGERPAPGSTAAVLLDDRRVYARIYVPEHLKARLVTGTKLGIAIDGVENPFTGMVSWVSLDASFTPYFALTEHDRSRLSFVAEVDIENAGDLPGGTPLEAWLPDRDGD
ncbi:MAG: HlyD family efflux transporter periplasmic adaptor subunit [Xanthomonadales bacterium]|nr:HlyD family efflux transporter periplasmic adaptor subunit [Xanthomonadales bacterium]